MKYNFKEISGYALSAVFLAHKINCAVRENGSAYTLPIPGGIKYELMMNGYERESNLTNADDFYNSFLHIKYYTPRIVITNHVLFNLFGRDFYALGVESTQRNVNRQIKLALHYSARFFLSPMFGYAVSVACLVPLCLSGAPIVFICFSVTSSVLLLVSGLLLETIKQREVNLLKEQNHLINELSKISNIDLNSVQFQAQPTDKSKAVGIAVFMQLIPLALSVSNFVLKATDPISFGIELTKISVNGYHDYLQQQGKFAKIQENKDYNQARMQILGIETFNNISLAQQNDRLVQKINEAHKNSSTAQTDDLLDTEVDLLVREKQPSFFKDMAKILFTYDAQRAARKESPALMSDKRVYYASSPL